jgi:carbamoyl-phosphate synthase large subunit
MEVRAGEVSKGMTRKHAGMMDMARRIAEALPGAFGSLNIQCFLEEGKTIRITEMNARFGGGFPLSCEAGADFPRWIVEELLGRPSGASWASWQDGLVMLRYDHAVFLRAEQLRFSSDAQTVRCV